MKTKKVKYYAGIDVQIKRGCSYYIIDTNKKYFSSGWIKDQIPQSFRNLFLDLTKNYNELVAIGIDAPRMPIDKLRKRSFNKKTNSWTNNSDEKLGRECEVIIKSYNIANPQWTRTIKDLPEWMKLGFSIYNALKDFPFVYEVFPSASYRMLEKENVKYELCLNNFSSGMKDMLDASIAAITVYDFLKGRGCEIVGGDGLGTIVLQRRIEN
ncbi:MAG: hypothetical protein N2321_00385 [Melioribacteraceae bacterium]|nr:hypothetical protein [Melioribacteraceae bacterium]